ncbi:MAG: hypothetical protein HQ556_08480 [Candidatus Marinimicrobia bacterium]|nr:hypothetical protein [Candidatus Neomarinimicrobiota bacterium]
MALTRFRAYQLGEEGSSFSYCHDGYFTLVEARITEQNISHVFDEIKTYGAGTLDVLHITSWDQDHCNPIDLKVIIKHLTPNIIEAPGYLPSTDSGKDSRNTIIEYKNDGGIVRLIDPTFLNSLGSAEELKRNDVVLWPWKLDADNDNNNSVAKLFRAGHFTVLSLGDIETESIADSIISGEILSNEVDVMILAHHGADNGFTNDKMLKTLNPRAAICTSNYDNQYHHPKQSIQQLLNNNDIPLFTTKTGDVIIQSGDDVSEYSVFNLIANTSKVSSSTTIKAKSY